MASNMPSENRNSISTISESLETSDVSSPPQYDLIMKDGTEQNGKFVQL